VSARTALIAMAAAAALTSATALSAPAVSATSSPSPSAAPSASPGPAPATVVGSRVDPAGAATLPVEDLTAPVEDLVFATGSADGAVVDRGDRDFTLNSDVLFAFDQAVLTPRARRELARIAGVLKSSAAPAPTAVSITGYTDDVGSDAYNLALSRRRAEAVRKELQAALDAGVRVQAAGRGESAPVATNKSPRGRALHRRVEIRST
jgi:outer membrane protein OmpA-like peptidoglycan-associated protein